MILHGAIGTGLGVCLRVGAILFFLAGTCSLFLVTRLTFIRANVQNVFDPCAFTAHNLDGFIHQSWNSPSLLRFRELVKAIPPSPAHSLQTAVAVRKWVRAQQPDSERCWYPHRRETEDPETLLAQQSRGVPGACRRFSYILTGALLSVGLDARVVVFGKSFDQRSERSHTAVEVWCEELEKWVFLDPTYDTLIRIDGVPASAFEVYRAVKGGEAAAMSFDRDGSERSPAPGIRAVLSCLRAYLRCADEREFSTATECGCSDIGEFLSRTLWPRERSPIPRARNECCSERRLHLSRSIPCCGDCFCPSSFAPRNDEASQEAMVSDTKK